MKTLSYSGVLYDDRRQFYLEGKREPVMLYSSVTPFISSLFARGGEKTKDKDFKMFEHRAAWRYQQLLVNAVTPAAWTSAGAPGGTATVAVDGAEGVTVDSSLVGTQVDIYDNAKTTRKGVALITAVSGSDVTLKVVGNPTSATFANAALADNDVLMVIGTAFGEGDDAPDASSDELSLVWNSVQRFKTSVEITEDLKQAALRPHGSPELARLRNEKQKEHKIKMERTFLWGVRNKGIGGTAHNAGGGDDSEFVGHITDANGRVVSTTMGVISAIERYGRPLATDDQQNLFLGLDANTYQYADFVKGAEKVFQYGGSGELTAYVGHKVLTFLSTRAVSNSGWEISISGTQKSRIGFNYRIIETPHGILRAVPMPIFRRTAYDGSMLIIDEENLTRKVYKASEYRTNIKTDNAPDLQKDVFQSWEGLCISLMEKHSLWQFTNL